MNRTGLGLLAYTSPSRIAGTIGVEAEGIVAGFDGGSRKVMPTMLSAAIRK